MTLRYVLVVSWALAVSACSTNMHSVPQSATPSKNVASARFEVQFGIISRPDIRPWVLDIKTTQIPLGPDGNLPKMGALVTGTTQESFALSYVVYRKDERNGKFQLTERSVRWRISEQGGHPPSALIAPDFIDGVLLGDYKFEIYVDDQLAKTVIFSVVRSVT